jgi:hypothetical protein
MSDEAIDYVISTIEEVCKDRRLQPSRSVDGG